MTKLWYDSGMIVKLIDSTVDPISNICMAAGVCRDRRKTDYKEQMELLRALVAGDHSSVEFAWCMWEFDGISRACADQLRTYRLASHNMLSQRHVDLLKRDFIHPHKGLELCEGVLEMEKKQKEFYAMLVNNGVPKEDARYYMGIGISTHMFTACNFRELRHILKQRLVPSAQWEIRKVCKEMYDICLDKWPWLVFDINA